jgi:hypothetical protein
MLASFASANYEGLSEFPVQQLQQQQQQQQQQPSLLNMLFGQYQQQQPQLPFQSQPQLLQPGSTVTDAPVVVDTSAAPVVEEITTVSEVPSVTVPAFPIQTEVPTESATEVSEEVTSVHEEIIPEVTAPAFTEHSEHNDHSEHVEAEVTELTALEVAQDTPVAISEETTTEQILNPETIQ